MCEESLSKQVAIEITKEVHKRDITIGDLEKKLELSPGYISRCRKGNKHLSIDVIDKIESAMKIDILNKVRSERS